MSSNRPSYKPLDPSSLHPDIDVHPRPLAPIQPPPSPLALPPLPSPVRNPSFSPSYTLTTHLIPSAYPRSPSSHLPRSEYADKPGESKAERIKRQEQFAHDLWSRNVALVTGKTGETRGEVLWNVVNRFVRKDAGKRQGGVTLFLAHANGFPKEIWEPSLLRILSRAEAANVTIDEVWAFESVQHGDSALVNEHAIGDVFDWADNARDILNILLHYLPDKASPTPLPTHLPRFGDDIASHRQASGFKDRTFVGIGHSLGGCSTLRAALAHPALFASIMLVDPVIVPRWSRAEGKIPGLTLGAIRRRTAWGSREEALAGFRSSPFFTAWDPAVLEKYVDHGLGPDPDANSKDAVRLKMSGAQEAIVFADRRVCFETWQLMPQLDTRIELRFVMNGKDTEATGGDRATHEMVWRRAGNVSNVRIPSAGHLIPQEAPDEFAEEVVEFLKKKYAPGQGGKAKL